MSTGEGSPYAFDAEHGGASDEDALQMKLRLISTLESVRCYVFLQSKKMEYMMYKGNRYSFY